MLLSGENWKPHRFWARLCVLCTVGFGLWFASAAARQPSWPGGSSAVGLTCGLVGGAIVVFEFALWLRKKVRARRLGKAQRWLRAHIWLGLLSVPVLLIHSGFRFGGPLSATLMVLLLAVVASGLWGLYMQSRLPRRLLEEFPGENIASQIARRCRELENEAAQLVATVCGLEKKEAPEENGEAYVQVGGGKQVAAFTPRTMAGCEPLARFFENTAAPYLRQGRSAAPLLAHVGGAADLFGHVRGQVPPEAHAAVDVLEDLCSQRRQLDQQARTHLILHCWLLVHFPLSVALVILMAVHIVAAFKYY